MKIVAAEIKPAEPKETKSVLPTGYQKSQTK